MKHCVLSTYDVSHLAMVALREGKHFINSVGSL